VLSKVNPGIPLPLETIAKVCGCRKSYIHAIEKRALKKLRDRLKHFL